MATDSVIDSARKYGHQSYPDYYDGLMYTVHENPDLVHYGFSTQEKAAAFAKNVIQWTGINASCVLIDYPQTVKVPAMGFFSEKSYTEYKVHIRGVTQFFLKALSQRGVQERFKKRDSMEDLVLRRTDSIHYNGLSHLVRGW